MVIKLIRHGQSRANVGEVCPAECGDHTVELTPLGHAQGEAAGRAVGADFIRGALVYTSPFRRTRQTMAAVLRGAGIGPDEARVLEDPRLREMDFGYGDPEAQQAMRRTHGWFYYRYQGGESPADCYDRTSGFLESLMRTARKKKFDRALIVTHGLTIRCFTMRFLHLTVEQFDIMANPGNGCIVTIGPRGFVEDPLFVTERWAVGGLERLGEG